MAVVRTMSCFSNKILYKLLFVVFPRPVYLFLGDGLLLFAPANRGFKDNNNSGRAELMQELFTFVHQILEKQSFALEKI